VIAQNKGGKEKLRSKRTIRLAIRYFTLEAFVRAKKSHTKAVLSEIAF